MRELAEIVALRSSACRRAEPWLAVIAEAGVGDVERMGTAATMAEASDADRLGWLLDESAKSPEIAEVMVHAQHALACPRCRREVVSYRELLDELAWMREDLVDPPEEAIAALVSKLGEHPVASRLLKAAYVGGITVATAAAGAAGIAVWLTRRRSALAAVS